MEEEEPRSIMDLPAIREFDAFPKTLPNYKQRSSRGGVLTVFVACLILVLIWHELKEYLFGEPKYSFLVDPSIAHSLGINIDLTVAMPCHFIITRHQSFQRPKYCMPRRKVKRLGRPDH
ncbi:hypothetical protein PGTUg99_008107 [Puccinia graminis f. sp. tritici]|uniref:Endoplasmic reticulum vesicle transporter N-terminal domain-containing protein n=1 Tax=Puccinia graminis f. sp. tritici TaxID=56615 RepID=A0A5B0PVV0_PUCGR|nr:hypothetical protein PGTUg99_008107 [Puccinia graminis f. sp. tritici]